MVLRINRIVRNHTLVIFCLCGIVGILPDIEYLFSAESPGAVHQGLFLVGLAVLLAVAARTLRYGRLDGVLR